MLWDFLFTKRYTQSTTISLIAKRFFCYTLGMAAKAPKREAKKKKESKQESAEDVRFFVVAL